jgi:hypothetical protein
LIPAFQCKLGHSRELTNGSSGAGDIVAITAQCGTAGGPCVRIIRLQGKGAFSSDLLIMQRVSPRPGPAEA